MLIDTSVWSELTRSSPEPRVIAFLAQNRDRCFLSTIVLAEMEYGIAKVTDPVRRARLIGYRDDVEASCTDRLLLPDDETAVIWGRLRAELEQKGEAIAAMDLMIASQSIAGAMPLVTRNISDMARTGADIINPWDL